MQSNIYPGPKVIKVFSDFRLKLKSLDLLRMRFAEKITSFENSFITSGVWLNHQYKCLMLGIHGHHVCFYNMILTIFFKFYFIFPLLFTFRMWPLWISWLTTRVSMYQYVPVLILYFDMTSLERFLSIFLSSWSTHLETASDSLLEPVVEVLIELSLSSPTSNPIWCTFVASKTLFTTSTI